MERVAPKKARVPQPNVIAVRVANLFDKDFLLARDPVEFFTEAHYDGFPAILVRLPAVTARELRPLITEAWRCQAPKDWTRRRRPLVGERPDDYILSHATPELAPHESPRGDGHVTH